MESFDYLRLNFGKARMYSGAAADKEFRKLANIKAFG